MVVFLDGQSFGQEAADVLAEAEQFAHDAGADAREFGFGEEQDGLDAGELPVDVGDGFFVFEVFHRAYAAHDEACVHALCEVDGQVVVGFHFHARFVLVEVTYHVDALLRGEPRAFVFVDANADDHFVHKGECSPHDGIVSDGKRVECAREDGSFHVFRFGYASSSFGTSSSTTRLLMMKFWRSIVFFPM